MSGNPCVAFMFPGQGSQYVGMLSETAEAHASVRHTFAEAADALGYDLWELIQRGSADELSMTEVTQPALLASSVALWRSWRAAGGSSPAVMAGHSLGEFSALVCAGAMGFADGLRLVRARGAAMQAAVPVGRGAMSAVIGLDDDAVDAACIASSAQTGSVVAAVNYNSPGQVVIAGYADAVEEAASHCKAAGAKRVMALPVSAPFHTVLMEPAGEKLQAALEHVSITAPDIPVIHNVHAQAETSPDVIRELLVQQIHSPVLWTACARAMIARGADMFVECGPGKVLCGLLRRIDRAAQGQSIEVPSEFEAAMQAAQGEQK